MLCLHVRRRAFQLLYPKSKKVCDLMRNVSNKAMRYIETLVCKSFRRIGVVGVGVVAGLMICCTSIAENDGLNGPQDLNMVQMKIELLQKVIMRGQPIWTELVFENTGKKAVSFVFEHRPNGDNVDFQLKRDSKNLSAAANSRRAGYGKSSEKRIVLDPNKSYRVRLLVNRWVGELPQVGEYRVRCVVSIPGRIFDSSVPLKVEDADPKVLEAEFGQYGDEVLRPTVNDSIDALDILSWSRSPFALKSLTEILSQKSGVGSTQIWLDAVEGVKRIDTLAAAKSLCDAAATFQQGSRRDHLVFSIYDLWRVTAKSEVKSECERVVGKIPETGRLIILD